MMKIRGLARALAVAGGMLPGLCALADYNVQLNSASCNPGGTISVSVDVSQVTNNDVAGGQFFLSFDASRLQYLSISYPPGVREVFRNYNNTTGRIDLAVGIRDGVNGNPPVPRGTGSLATIVFTTTGTSCAESGLVSFRSNTNPPSRLTNSTAQALTPFATSNLGPVYLNDTSAPVINSGNPIASVNDNADSTFCTRLRTIMSPSATDNCLFTITASIGGTPYDPSMLYAFPVGTTVITWTATDPCGNSSSATQNVIIADTQNPMITCPGNITRNNDANLCGAAVLVGTPTASDNCGVQSVVGTRSDAQSLTSEYPVGITTITWVATDVNGNTSQCMQTVTVNDVQAPSITCPADLALFSDAGRCSATLNYTNSFDVAPLLTNSNASVDGQWYIDRYAPAGFTNAMFLGQNRLRVSLSSADSAANRPPGFQTTFYSTQGRSYNVNLQVGQTLAADLYIPSTWATSVRRADIWGVGFNSQNSIANFPIIGFVSDDPSDPFNTSPTNPTPRWRYWNNGWTNIATPIVYDAWHRLEIKLTATTYDYRLDGLLVGVAPNNNSVRIGSTIIQAFNFGESYDVYWDNLLFGPPGPVATDNCGIASVVPVRSDSPLTLADPFPQGTTTITWTATDIHGNSTPCTQRVVVSNTSLLNVDVELLGASSGTAQRCIDFNAYTATSCPSAAFSQQQTLTFVNGLASTTLVVPCSAGTYTQITATDPKHTLRRTGPITINGATYAASFTTLSRGLIGGNVNNDPYVDILDFGGYIGQFGLAPGANTDCSASLNADFDANGSIGTEDFTFIQANFLTFRDSDPCGNQLQIPPNQPGGPVTDISVLDLTKLGLRSLARADRNLDNRLNTLDVAQVLTQGYSTKFASDFTGDGVVATTDIFDFLKAYFMNHPRADFNNNGGVNVTDIFEFLGVWFRKG